MHYDYNNKQLRPEYCIVTIAIVILEPSLNGYLFLTFNAFHNQLDTAGYIMVMLCWLCTLWGIATRWLWDSLQSLQSQDIVYWNCQDEIRAGIYYSLFICISVHTVWYNLLFIVCYTVCNFTMSCYINAQGSNKLIYQNLFECVCGMLQNPRPRSGPVCHIATNTHFDETLNCTLPIYFRVPQPSSVI